MAAAPLRHLVVLIPGMGGSELVDPTQPPEERRVWYSGLGSIARAVADPTRLRVDRPLEAVGLLKDFTVVPWLKSIDGYGQTWAAISGTFSEVPIVDLGCPDRPRVDAQIVAFPYDFRLGVDHAAEKLSAFLQPRIESLGERTTVVIVGHSMGGLVGRRWASQYDREGRCRGIVALGCPFRGAPKALDVLVNGLYWGSQSLQRRKLSAVVQAWPGLHDLVSIDGRVRDGSGRWRSPWEISDLPGARVIGPARERHVGTRSWWAEPGRVVPTLLPVSGYGHATASTATWIGGQLRLDKVGLQGERDGDGTVPDFAAVPPEWSGPDATSRRRPCGDTHGAIGHTGRLREYLLLLNSGDPPPTRGESGYGFLGFDVEPMVEPGDVLTGGLRFNGETVAIRSVDGAAAITATFRDEIEGEEAIKVGLGDSDRFVIELPVGREGVVELQAKVDLPGRKRASERVVVLGARD